jgi:hypothetical protein
MPKDTNIASLAPNELDKEMEAIKNCWGALKGLRTEQRVRVAQWLQSWIRSEDGDGGVY